MNQPAPEKCCPTCGSPSKRGTNRPIDAPSLVCADPWHDALPVEPQPVVSTRGVKKVLAADYNHFDDCGCERCLPRAVETVPVVPPPATIRTAYVCNCGHAHIGACHVKECNCMQFVAENDGRKEPGRIGAESGRSVPAMDVFATPSLSNERPSELSGVVPQGAEQPLTFSILRAANISRCSRWHPRGLSEWSLSDWGVATAGEMGEALNVIKKLNRERDGIAGNTATAAELTRQLADEIADVAIYLDILAASEGIDLAAAIVKKFNYTSEKVGFPERLAHAAASQAENAELKAQLAHEKARVCIGGDVFEANRNQHILHLQTETDYLLRAEIAERERDQAREALRDLFKQLQLVEQGEGVTFNLRNIVRDLRKALAAVPPSEDAQQEIQKQVSNELTKISATSGATCVHGTLLRENCEQCEPSYETVESEDAPATPQKE